jgi:hypothetical protein
MINLVLDARQLDDGSVRIQQGRSVARAAICVLLVVMTVRLGQATDSPCSCKRHSPCDLAVPPDSYVVAVDERQYRLTLGAASGFSA